MATDAYMGWQTPQHAGGCTRQWSVRHRSHEWRNGERDLVIQMVCPLPVGGCGVYHEWQIRLAPDRDDDERLRSGVAQSAGPVQYIGYGTRPIKAGGVWLHARPPLLPGLGDGEGPDGWLVSASATPPTEWDQVLGVIGPARHRGRQLKSRWLAAAGHVPHRDTPGATPRHTRDDLPSRAAAVRWVLEQQTESETP